METIEKTIESVASTVNSFLARKPEGPKVRYAVVGAGWISQGAFMPGVAQTSNSVLTALVTGDQEKANTLAKQYNLKSYSYENFDQCINSKDVDAIYLATPNWMHKQFAVPALLKGVHVLLEKPMEVTEEDSQAIIDAAKKTGAKLMIAYRLHFEPGSVEVIDRVNRGDFGEPRIFSSIMTQSLKSSNHRAKHGFEGGPIFDMGVYPLNAVRNLFFDEPIEVHAVGCLTPGRESLQLEHDTYAITLKFPRDRIAQFIVGYSANPSNSFTIVGTKGEIQLNPAFMFGPGVKIAYKAKIEDKEETKEFPEVDHFAGETEYFSECILNDKEVEPDGEEGLADVRVCMAIKKSLETGNAVKLSIQPKSKRPHLDQVKKLPLAPQPKDFVGRDSQPPSH